MSPDTRLGLFLLLICAVDFCAPKDTRVVPARSGEDVALPCQAPTNASIRLIEWRKTDLKSEKYFFFYRENRPYKSFQLPSFHGRVELRDPEMKDGDASVILRNVTVDDTGTYECWIMTDERDASDHFSIINLSVRDGGDEKGGDEKGGDKEGGDKEGGDEKGGDKEGGDKEGGDKEGGDKEGGDKEGGDKEGGPLYKLLGLLAAALLLIVCGCVIWKCQRSMKKNSEPACCC